MTNLFLPNEKRRTAKERLNDILADPRASSCNDECHICSKLSPETAQAALLIWDESVRSGIWPIKTERLYRRLLESNHAIGKDESRNKLYKFIRHRRMLILLDLVEQDKMKWGVPAAEHAGVSIS